jgi:hypothetical protein
MLRPLPLWPAFLAPDPDQAHYARGSPRERPDPPQGRPMTDNQNTTNPDPTPWAKPMEERTIQYHDRDDDWHWLVIGFLGAVLAGGIAAVLLMLAADTIGIL